MSTLVLDTNIVSFVLDDRPEAKLYRWHLDGNALTISFMTVAELYQGAYWAKWGVRKTLKLEHDLHDRYVVLHSTPDICRRWGAVRFERRSNPVSVDDAWIAATALTYDCPLVTHNPKDFQGIRGLRVITEAGK